VREIETCKKERLGRLFLVGEMEIGTKADSLFLAGISCQDRQR